MKKNVIFISISLGLIILLGIGFSYSMWNISVSQDTTNMAESKCFDLSITNKENNISLDNAYPISNDKGKSLTPFTFTVTNTCDITAQYNINLEVLNSSTLSSKFIDVMFEGNINLLSSYDTTDKVNTSSIESRKLTTGILKSRESKDYSLRLWLDYNTTLEDLNNEIKNFKSKIVVVGKPINYTGDTVFNFDYTGAEQTFIAPVSGIYKLETWGAQGGSVDENYTGGLGGYSHGYLMLSINQKNFIYVGGSGASNNPNPEKVLGGYNGGGAGYSNFDGHIVSSGGGATHISLHDGLLNKQYTNIEKLILVSGGGGGSYIDYNYKGSGGSGGGYKGTVSKDFSSSRENQLSSEAGTQINGGHWGRHYTSTYDGLSDKSNGNFGQGGYIDAISSIDTIIVGGGAGYYGGGASYQSAGAGGSGYIGNPLLTNKVMYCYNCEESNEESTKTISTTCNEETPTSYCAKKGNGYARITLVSID